MELTKQEKSQLRHLVESPQWPVVQRVADLLCEQIGNQALLKDTEWETLKAVVGKEGKIQGIRLLLQEIFLQIQ